MPLTDRRPNITAMASSLRDRVPAAAQPYCLALALLLARHLRVDAADPLWRDRDRVVLAPDLACLGQQAAEALGARGDLFDTPAAPLAAGLGMALAERQLAARFGRSLVDHRSWVIGAGGPLTGGALMEACWLAGAWRLGRLTMIACIARADAPGLGAFEANGWNVRVVTDDDAQAIAAAFSAAQRSHRPTLIACATGMGPPPPASEDPVRTAQAWEAAGKRMASVRRTWLKRLARHGSRLEFETTMTGRLAPGWHDTLSGPAAPLADQAPISTAASLRAALAGVVPLMPDLTPLPGHPAWLAAPALADATQHGQAIGELVLGITGAMCGIGLHGGCLPMAVHRLASLESAWPALCQAARLGLRLVEVLVEQDDATSAACQLATLRAMDNLLVFRPADASEALECLELALRRTSGPAILLVSERVVARLADRPARTRATRGAYVLLEADGGRDATLIASGPDLHIALLVSQALRQDGLKLAVISLPCWNLLAAGEPNWRARTLGDATRFALEAGSGFGWERWLGDGGVFIDTRAQTGLAQDATQDIVARCAGLIRRRLG